MACLKFGWTSNRIWGQGDFGCDIFFNQLFVPGVGHYYAGGNTRGNSQLFSNGKSKVAGWKNGFQVLPFGDFRRSNRSALLENYLKRPPGPGPKKCGQPVCF